MVATGGSETGPESAKCIRLGIDEVDSCCTETRVLRCPLGRRSRPAAQRASTCREQQAVSLHVAPDPLADAVNKRIQFRHPRWFHAAKTHTPLAEGVSTAGFVDIDPRKIGGRKPGHSVWPPDELPAKLRDALVLGAVGNRGARGEIRARLRNVGWRERDDFVFVA